MKLSTKARYGVRFLIDLAMNYESGLVTINQVSENENISIKYLEQIVAQLRHEGIVKSMRGAHGGYELAINPSEISLRRIVDCLDGKICVVDCIDDGFCSRNKKCAAQDAWKILNDNIISTLESITLSNLIEISNEKYS